MKSRLIAAVLVLCTLCCAAYAEPPTHPARDFDKAKVLARNQVFEGNLIDFYCGCGYEPTKTASGGKLIPGTCGYEAKSNHTTGARLEWEHVVPAAYFGRERACWKDGNAQCTKNGKSFFGRKCCQLVDAEYKHMEGDLHNLVPSVGELNNNRSDLPYAVVDEEPRLYGTCDFEIGGDPKVTEPPDNVRGDAARIWFYMMETYGVHVSEEEMTMLKAWSYLDPVSDWERVRDERIKQVQGNSNHYVSGPEVEVEVLRVDLEGQ